MRKCHLESFNREGRRSQLDSRRPRPLILDPAALEKHARAWIMDGEVRQLSHNTLAFRRLVTDKLLWFLREQAIPDCDRDAILQFLAYIGNGHKQEGGRWGNPRFSRPVKPRTVQAYHVDLRTFFGYLVREGLTAENPLDRIPKPIVRQDQIQPFTPEQIKALLAAAKRSALPTRNQAILLFLLDTGARAEEATSLRLPDVDLGARCCTVLGKGNKERRLYFSTTTKHALWNYLQAVPHAEDDPLFLSERGLNTGTGLTPNSLLQLIRRLGIAAAITGTRCSPHTFRHTFAINFLRNGGNVFTLKQMLGHTTLTMVNRYLALAEADLEIQHRQFSPVETLIGGKRGRGR